MKKPLQISIPTPCPEDWRDMKPVEVGRFCDSCQKNVVDFTRASDREIASVLRSQQNVCGRFRDDQLQRDLFLLKEKKSWWTAAGAAAIGFLSLGIHEAAAQEKVPTEQTETGSGQLLGDTILVSKKYRITGTLKDIKAAPVPNAKIAFHDKPGCLVTDAEGRFFIDAEDGEMIGLETPDHTFIIIDANPLTPKTFKLRVWQTGTSTTMGLTATLTKKRTFFGRIFHSIGSLFRKE